MHVAFMLSYKLLGFSSCIIMLGFGKSSHICVRVVGNDKSKNKMHFETFVPWIMFVKYHFINTDCTYITCTIWGMYIVDNHVFVMIM